ncbi:helix-turn-helix domain-containing protein [Massilia antarctica]|uniref:Helix-turn-helix domain-containing protein n=1 Tax=Massilia antarctica TaxID=2765360 RepID=A0AA48WH91_9BURK|nr:helix-turn-helix domain-containing protein [Massilia antarctica]
MARTLSVPGTPVGPRMSSLADLGDLVRNRRLELRLRIDDAAHACGVAANVFSRLENGGPIGADRLLLVLAGLGLTMLVTTKEHAHSILPASDQYSGGPL